MELGLHPRHHFSKACQDHPQFRRQRQHCSQFLRHFRRQFRRQLRAQFRWHSRLQFRRQCRFQFRLVWRSRKCENVKKYVENICILGLNTMILFSKVKFSEDPPVIVKKQVDYILNLNVCDQHTGSSTTSSKYPAEDPGIPSRVGTRAAVAAARLETLVAVAAPAIITFFTHVHVLQCFVKRFGLSPILYTF